MTNSNKILENFPTSNMPSGMLEQRSKIKLTALHSSMQRAWAGHRSLATSRDLDQHKRSALHQSSFVHLRQRRMLEVRRAWEGPARPTTHATLAFVSMARAARVWGIAALEPSIAGMESVWLTRMTASRIIWPVGLARVDINVLPLKTCLRKAGHV